jgi:hypothetical protein
VGKIKSTEKTLIITVRHRAYLNINGSDQSIFLPVGNPIQMPVQFVPIDCKSVLTHPLFTNLPDFHPRMAKHLKTVGLYFYVTGIAGPEIGTLSKFVNTVFIESSIFRGHNTNYPATFNLYSQRQACAERTMGWIYFLILKPSISSSVSPVYFLILSFDSPSRIISKVPSIPDQAAKSYSAT